MQSIEEILNIINEKNLNVSDISRRTGIPGTRIYKWLDGKGRPKAEDASKMQAWAAKHLEVVLIPPTVDTPVGASNTVSPEPTPMQILDRLSQAFIDQAKALADQAEGFKAQAEAFKVQGELMRNIESRMAREITLADVALNLQRVFGGVETMGERQEAAIKTILSDLNKIKAQTKVPS